MTVTEASAPGKLFIAGEYAVVTPGHPSILVALDQFITVSLEEADTTGTIRSAQYGGLPIPWTREEDQLVIDQRENPFLYITEAVKVTERFIKESGIPLSYFHLSAKSELDNASGKKYGLGSSGAVTVATIKALLKFYAIDPEFELVYKLASLAHLSVKSNGSFGDIAASTYGGWIAYACFDREWVMEKATELTLTELLKTEWPQLMIRPLTPPANLRLVIGWTGSPASTTHLVDRVNDVRGGIDDFYKTFLGASKTCVNAMIAAFEKGDLQAIQAGIRENRLLLQQLTAHTGVVIETPPLTQLCDLAEKNLGAAKSSGAGGGDCGIVIIDRQSGIIPLISEWEKVGIMNLPLHVFKYVRAAAPIEWKGASE